MIAATSRRIVLTGTSRGLGRAMLGRFAELGHIVYGCATNADIIHKQRDEFSSPHQLSVVDVASDRQVEDWARSVLEHGGPPDLVINNAALINTSAMLWDVHPKEFDALMNVNVTGAYHVIRHFVPAMISAGAGVIVNFSSGWGRATSPEVVPYCASKFAVEGLSRGLAQELPRGLASVAFNPGIIHTDMLDSCFGGTASSFPAPKQWAKRAVPFLLQLDASDNGSSVDLPA